MSPGEVSRSVSAATRTKPLRVGVLCNRSGLTAWQVSSLRKIEQLDFVEIVLFVCNSQSNVERASAWRRLYQKLVTGLLLWRAYERFALDRKSVASRPSSIPPSLKSVPTIYVEPVAAGRFRQVFDGASLEEVRKYDLDVLLRFGFGILTGEILKIPRFGIWSFHHGDPARFRGAPPGFWEIHNGDPVTGAILQRLTEKLDGGVVLHAGWFKTNPASYFKSLDRILFGAAHFVAHALTELWQNPEELMSRGPIQKPGPIYRYPRTWAMLIFFLKTTAAKIRNQFRALFRHQQWSVGILDEPTASIFESLSGAARRAEGVKWLPESRGRFLADPFSITMSGESVILAEEFDWSTGQGRISTVPCTTNTDEATQPAIESEFHLSYPYTFEYEGQMYCAPECAQSNGVILYRFLREEGRWIEHKQLIRDFPAVDPTIFCHDGRWWLFCTNAETGANEFLHAWFADEPTGEWRAHPANPLKVDIRSARPAGRPFVSRAALIRPAQDCSRVYGGAITFSRVLKLTPEQFCEEPAGQLCPPNDRYDAGLHTISAFGEQTIIDGARLVFVPKEFWRLVHDRLHKALR